MKKAIAIITILFSTLFSLFINFRNPLPMCISSELVILDFKNIFITLLLLIILKMFMYYLIINFTNSLNKDFKTYLLLS